MKSLKLKLRVVENSSIKKDNPHKKVWVVLQKIVLVGRNNLQFYPCHKVRVQTNACLVVT